MLAFKVARKGSLCVGHVDNIKFLVGCGRTEKLQLTSRVLQFWLLMMSSARQARFNSESPKQVGPYSSNIIVFSNFFFHSQFLQIICRQKHERLIF